ncbi:hypothetical protein HFN89_06665 [Rhizobium laguerreae]|nr:hypothetical protein [Rhizobium laguerreae]
MKLDELLFNEDTLVKAPLSWRGSFLIGDDNDSESPGSAVDDSVKLLLAEVQELGDKGHFSRGGVFLDVDALLRELAATSDARMGVDVTVFIEAAKRAMSRIVPSMATMLIGADLTVWLNVYARIGGSIAEAQRVYLKWMGTRDECSTGWWEAKIGADRLVNRLRRAIGLYRGLPAANVAMALVATFEDIDLALASQPDDVRRERVGEFVAMANGLSAAVGGSKLSTFAGYQGFAANPIAVDRQPWVVRFERALASMKSSTVGPESASGA